MASTSTKKTILNLPISNKAPIYHLRPDPLFPSPATLFGLSAYIPPVGLGESGPVALVDGEVPPPSMMRRSRQVRGGGAFSFTSPLPLEFPYDIQELGDKQEKEVGYETSASAVTIESALAKFEISNQFPVVGAVPGDSSRPTAFTSKARQGPAFPKPTLLSFSRRCREEFLPNLEVGDAETVVLKGDGTEEQVKIREELVSILAGKSVLAREGIESSDDPVEKYGFAPWSLCYAGHQFGGFAGQLGDGRAISLLSTPATAEVTKATGYSTIELQLKGAGRTPYSRFADGLAVLRSSVREYLGAEAMAALKQPTSRALALVGIPGVKVRREKIETAAIVTRVANSWIRIGSFEMQQTRKEWESLRILTNYVGTQVFGFETANCPPTDKGTGMGLNVLKETSKRTAIMIAGWQAYGFCHGVMNTDNFAVGGACIDYGPYAFMDIFDPGHVCNHSDEEGRYSYRNQPTMGVFAIDKLGTALAELIGCEEELIKNEEASPRTGYVSVGEGWGDVTDVAEKLPGWKAAGLLKIKEVKEEFVTIFMAEYGRLMGLRLGFTTVQPGDFQLGSNLLDLMMLHTLDYSQTLRLLSQFPLDSKSPLLPRFNDLLLPTSQVAVDARPISEAAFKVWLEQYRIRLSLPSELIHESTRRERMNLVNPRFILRQWVLEEIISKLSNNNNNNDDVEKIDLLALDRVLELSSEPFKNYGEELVDQVSSNNKELCEVESEEEKERRRLCEIGAENFQGFQCSCSS